MLLQLLLLVVLILWVIKTKWETWPLVKLCKQLHTPYRALPIIGHAYLFMGDDEHRMKAFQKIGMKAFSTGGVLPIWQLNKLYLNISDPTIGEFIMKSCLDKDDIVKCSQLLTGNGTVFAPVPIWRPRRKVLAPTFSPRNLQQFSEIFVEQSALMVKQLEAAAGLGAFSIWKYITTYSMDSVCESTLGVKVNAQKQPDQPFLKAFEELCKIDASRFCKPWIHNDMVFKMTPTYYRHYGYKMEIWGFIEKIIRAKRQQMLEEKNKTSEEDEPTRKSFLQLLIQSSESGGGYTETELREEIVVLVLAGTDTTAVGTSFTALMLAQHQDVQETLYREIQDIFGESDRPISVEDFPRLKYLDAVIRESLRLYPPAPIIVRKITKDVTLPSGLVLPKSVGLALNLWAMMRSPAHCGPDPHRFRPDRFLEGTPPFFAFSGGPRACIGYQYAMTSMKTAVTTLLRTYKLLPATPVVDKQAQLKVKFDVMMKSVDNFIIRIEKR